MTAPSATELPTAQPNVPANSRHPGPRAVPSVSSVLILPPGPIVDRHRRPQERLQAARRPPAYPNQARIIAPVTPSHPSAVLTPSTCMNRWIRAKPSPAAARRGPGPCGKRRTPQKAPGAGASASSGPRAHQHSQGVQWRQSGLEAVAAGREPGGAVLPLVGAKRQPSHERSRAE